LKREADQTDNRCCEPNPGRRKAEAAAEAEEALVASLWGAGIWEEDEGQRVECACVESEEELDEKSQEDIGCPDLPEARAFLAMLHPCADRA
jgi:hypothetical protein